MVGCPIICFIEAAEIIVLLNWTLEHKKMILVASTLLYKLVPSHSYAPRDQELYILATFCSTLCCGVWDNHVYVHSVVAYGIDIETSILCMRWFHLTTYIIPVTTKMTVLFWCESLIWSLDWSCRDLGLYVVLESCEYYYVLSYKMQHLKHYGK